MINVEIYKYQKIITGVKMKLQFYLIKFLLSSGMLFADQFFAYTLPFKIPQKSSIGRVFGALAGLRYFGTNSIFLLFSQSLTSFA